jgi:hypothetical protein
MSKSADDLKKFDVRCQERNIKYGLITRRDLEAHLATLPDVKAKAITLGETEDLRKAGGESQGN